MLQNTVWFIIQIAFAILAGLSTNQGLYLQAFILFGISIAIALVRINKVVNDENNHSR